MRFAMPVFSVGLVLAIVVVLVGLLVAIEVVPVNPLSVGGLFVGTGVAIIFR